jgi:hypothetical protein
MLGMGEGLLVLMLLAGGFAPEPVRWFGKIAITSGAPLGLLAFTRASGEVMGPVMVEPPPPPALKVPPPPRSSPPNAAKPPPKKAL